MLHVYRDPAAPDPTQASDSALAQALRENEERLRHATQAALVGGDQQARLVYLNRAARAFLGLGEVEPCSTTE